MKMCYRFEANSFSSVWFQLLRNLRYDADLVMVRGKMTNELLGVNIIVHDGLENLLVSPTRKLQVKFAVAEWLWIWFGHADVDTIAQYNPKIVEFSDDGKTFAGAYGPPVLSRWPIILQTLRHDPFSRQAIIPIFAARHPSVLSSKDVPCTISLQFLVREERVHVIATMRSSDVWLGLPYDFFNFSMLGNILSAQLGLKMGSVQMSLGSSHLYEGNFAAASEVIEKDHPQVIRAPQFTTAPPTWLDEVLEQPKEGVVVKHRQPWTNYGYALCTGTNSAAQIILQDILRHEPT